MEIVGYILYAGLGLSILSFFFLMLGMMSLKKEQAYESGSYGHVNEDGFDYEEEYDEDFEEEWDEEVEEVSKKKAKKEKTKRKSLIGSLLSKKKSKRNESEDDGFMDDDDDYYYEEEEEYDDVEDDYFDNAILERKNRKTMDSWKINDFEDEDIDVKEKLEIRRHSEDYFEEEEELTEEEKMLRKLEMHKKEFKRWED